MSKDTRPGRGCCQHSAALGWRIGAAAGRRGCAHPLGPLPELTVRSLSDLGLSPAEIARYHDVSETLVRLYGPRGVAQTASVTRSEPEARTSAGKLRISAL